MILKKMTENFSQTQTESKFLGEELEDVESELDQAFEEEPNRPLFFESEPQPTELLTSTPAIAAESKVNVEPAQPSLPSGITRGAEVKVETNPEVLPPVVRNISYTVDLTSDQFVRVRSYFNIRNSTLSNKTLERYLDHFHDDALDECPFTRSIRHTKRGRPSISLPKNIWDRLRSECPTVIEGLFNRVMESVVKIQRIVLNYSGRTIILHQTYQPRSYHLTIRGFALSLANATRIWMAVMNIVEAPPLPGIEEDILAELGLPYLVPDVTQKPKFTRHFDGMIQLFFNIDLAHARISLQNMIESEESELAFVLSNSDKELEEEEELTPSKEKAKKKKKKKIVAETSKQKAIAAQVNKARPYIILEHEDRPENSSRVVIFATGRMLFSGFPGERALANMQIVLSLIYARLYRATAE
jgi:hypothetical protein